MNAHVRHQLRLRVDQARREEILACPMQICGYCHQPFYRPSASPMKRFCGDACRKAGWRLTSKGRSMRRVENGKRDRTAAA